MGEVGATEFRMRVANSTICSSLSYPSRGQKNPLSPSFRRLGTTWAWRWATHHEDMTVEYRGAIEKGHHLLAPKNLVAG